MSLQRKLVSQFHKPQGLLGVIAGWIMATRTSNLERNQLTLDLLDLRSDDRVLELGPGPGVTLTSILQQVTNGSVVAVDHSEAMLARCRRTHKQACKAGRLTLVNADLSRLPDLGAPFNKILAVNSLQFDGMSAEAMASIITQLAPGGTLAITFQPRGQAPTNDKAAEFGRQLADLLRGAGLTNVRVETLVMTPNNAICVLGERAS